MFYTVYKITNTINDKIYIGTHRTENLDDSYMGSGKYLKRSIKKHGIENFVKEILHVYDNAEQMFAKESELVNEKFLKNTKTYNLKTGGFGGFDFINRVSCEKFWSDRNKKINVNRWNKLSSDERRLKTEKSRKNLKRGADSEDFTFGGMIHTDESKMKMSESHKLRMLKNNPHTGTRWITDGDINKKIKHTDSLPFGWYYGRTNLNRQLSQ